MVRPVTWEGRPAQRTSSTVISTSRDLFADRYETGSGTAARTSRTYSD